MQDELILVDLFDRAIGHGEKLDVHRRRLLHRAFSVFLVDENGRWLLQKRADGKYHSGGLWANACCSHPRWGVKLYLKPYPAAFRKNWASRAKPGELFSFIYYTPLPFLERI